MEGENTSPTHQFRQGNCKMDGILTASKWQWFWWCVERSFYITITSCIKLSLLDVQDGNGCSSYDISHKIQYFMQSLLPNAIVNILKTIFHYFIIIRTCSRPQHSTTPIHMYSYQPKNENKFVVQSSYLVNVMCMRMLYGYTGGMQCAGVANTDGS